MMKQDNTKKKAADLNVGETLYVASESRNEMLFIQRNAASWTCIHESADETDVYSSCHAFTIKTVEGFIDEVGTPLWEDAKTSPTSPNEANENPHPNAHKDTKSKSLGKKKE